MGQDRSTPPRSFNTVIKSNRAARAKRLRRGRITLLAICSVVILILLALIAFLVASIVDVLLPPGGGPADPNEQAPGTNVSYVAMAWESSKVSSGVLLVVNDDHGFDPDSVVGNLINIYENRTKIDGSNPYQINTVTAVYTQLTDVEDELNGLITYDRKVVKIPPARMAAIASIMGLGISG